MSMRPVTLIILLSTSATAIFAKNFNLTKDATEYSMASKNDPSAYVKISVNDFKRMKRATAYLTVFFLIIFVSSHLFSCFCWLFGKRVFSAIFRFCCSCCRRNEPVKSSSASMPLSDVPQA